MSQERIDEIKQCAYFRASIGRALDSACGEECILPIGVKEEDRQIYTKFVGKEDINAEGFCRGCQGYFKIEIKAHDTGVTNAIPPHNPIYGYSTEDVNMVIGWEGCGIDED